MLILAGHQSYQSEGMLAVLALLGSLVLGSLLMATAKRRIVRVVAVFATTALVTVTVGWMRSTWDDWYHHRCVEHNAKWCGTSEEPSFPFTHL